LKNLKELNQKINELEIRQSQQWNELFLTRNFVVGRLGLALLTKVLLKKNILFAFLGFISEKVLKSSSSGKEFLSQTGDKFSVIINSLLNIFSSKKREKRV
jgi:hypothetical protein